MTTGPTAPPLMSALSHLRVLDASRALAGPWATQLLGDMGAQVIKVERPGVGDEARILGPPYLRDREGRETTDATYFMAANRNKRSITLDFTKPQGQEVMRRLASEADVFVENYKTGALRQYGLDYASLRALNPKLIYCSITGFGQTGPYAGRAGYDVVIQAMSGLMSITGQPDGAPGAGPMRVGASVCDINTGNLAAIAILGALVHRGFSGVGQHIDLGLLDVQIACLANVSATFVNTGVEPKRMGNLHPVVVPYQAFAAADGDMILGIATDPQFARFAELVGHPEWAKDPRFATNGARVRNRDLIVPQIADVLRTRRTSEWVERFEPAAIPCGPINGLAQVFDDPQVKARGVKVTAPHSLAGEIPLVANPIRFSETPVQYRTAPPLLGEHTREILEEVGMQEADIRELVASGVVTLGPGKPHKQ